MIYKFDSRHSPIVRYDGDGLSDRSGHGLHLTGPNAVIRPVYENALGFSPSGVLNRNGISDALLRDLDGLTIQTLLILRAVPSSTWLCSFSAGGDAEAANYLWSIQLSSQNTLTYFTEHGAGIDLSPVFVAAPAGKGLPALGVPFHLALRLRAVPGGLLAQFFINGLPFGDPSGVLPPPTGGTAAQLLLNQSASTAFDLLAFEFDDHSLTDAEILDSYNRTLGEDFGRLDVSLQSLWLGGLTPTGVTAAVTLSHAADAVRLVATNETETMTTSAVDTDHGVTTFFSLTGLSPDTEYDLHVEIDGEELSGPPSHFRTAPSGPASFKVAFSADAASGSNHPSFEAILNAAPLVFLHLGDAHYHDIGTNDPTAFRAAFDEMLAQPRQAALYANVPTIYIPDDHDFGANNSNGSSPSRPAVTSVYRQRVPSYPLVEPGPNGSFYHSFDVGRVRFLVTDQRSAASPNSLADNASKSMLGTAQKAWFKNLLANSPGMLLVWCCPRQFQQPLTAGSDSWGGFSTERAELVTWIHDHCPGRVVVLSGDMHALSIDDGSNTDYLPGGGEPLPLFQASPLDIASPAGSGTYSEGLFVANGQFGTMEVVDTAGPTVDVLWKGWNSSGTLLATYAFTVTL